MSDERLSWQKQLAEAQENLRLVRERRAEFVQQTDVPLQLIKDERRLEREIERLRRQLERTTAPALPEERELLPTAPRRRTWGLVVGVIGLALLLSVAAYGLWLSTRNLGSRVVPSPTTSTDLTATPERAEATLSLKLIRKPWADGNVRAILLTRGGPLVVGDGKGVVRLGVGPDPARANGLPLDALALAAGSDEQLWLGTERGLAELTLHGDEWHVSELYTQTDRGVSLADAGAVAFEPGRGVWMGTGILNPGPGVHLLDPAGRWHTCAWDADETYPVNDVEQDLQGRLWIATDGGGLRVLDPSTCVWLAEYSQRTCADQCPPSDVTFAIHVTEQFKWVATDQGVGVLNDQGDRPTWRIIGLPHGLPASWVTALAGDGAERVFVGTVRGLGVVEVIDDVPTVRTVQLVGGSLDCYVSALSYTADQLWVGSLEDGLSVWSVEENAALPP